MVYVEFIKDHPAGIKAGVICIANDSDAKRWIGKEYAKSSTKDAYEASLNKPALIDADLVKEQQEKDAAEAKAKEVQSAKNAKDPDCKDCGEDPKAGKKGK